MQYKRLGRAGVKVSKICLGTAFRGFWHGQTDEATCIRVVDRAIDLGCNFIDCANYYFQGRCESVLGKAIVGKRDDLFLTSKVWSRIGEGPNDAGLSRYHIMREVDRSLKRLRTDHIDLYLLHNHDPDTPLEETLAAMDHLVRQGKVRYVGSCNFTTWQLMEALWVADTHSLTAFSCIQNQYNLLHRYEMEPDLMPVCRKYGLGIMTYSPLAIGLLAGGYRRGQPPPAGSPWGQGRYDFDRAMNQQNDAIIAALVDIGARHGKTPAQVAIAWILDHEEVTAPIVGPDLPEHVDEVIGALECDLTVDDRQALDEISDWVRPQGYGG